MRGVCMKIDVTGGCEECVISEPVLFRAVLGIIELSVILQIGEKAVGKV